MKQITRLLLCVVSLCCFATKSFSKDPLVDTIKIKATPEQVDLVGTRKVKISINKRDTTGAAARKLRRQNRKFETSMVMDLGWNFLDDKTDYNKADVKNYLKVPANQQNTALLGLRQNKSVNVNIYMLSTYKAYKSERQKILISTGLGLQLYNFRFDNNISFNKGIGGVYKDTLSFHKDKVAFDYLNVPLIFTFKTRLWQNEKNHKKDKWLVYGAGVTGGYALSIWTKQVSNEKGKIKVHDPFGFNPFNSCVTAEIGIEDVLRFYFSYQLTNMFNDAGSKATGMDMHPMCFGFKLSGI